MTPTVHVTASGPFHCPSAQVAGAPGAEVWLCRCGRSASKPHCDGSHRAAGFTDPGVAAPTTVGTPGAAPLAVGTRPNGPLLLTGNVVVADAAGTVIFAGDRCVLCRCGASATRPFCDATHKRIGFEAP